MTFPHLPRLDDYCRTTCRAWQCDANRDCGMLKFRRKQEVQERLGDIAAYLDRRHTAAGQTDLVARFFVDRDGREGVDAAGRAYLAGEFGRLLGEALRRDRRFAQRRVTGGEVVWALAGAAVADPIPEEPRALPRSEEIAPIVDAILSADGPVALREALEPAGDPATLTAREEWASGALRDRSDLRCVFVDPRRGVGTHWASLTWLRAHLPADAHLRPIPAETFRRAGMTAAGAEDLDAVEQAILGPGASEEEDESPEGTGMYIFDLDDVVSGSLLLRPQDFRHFPAHPNPLALEVRDENGTLHNALVYTRDGQRELRGLAELALEGGGVGLRVRLVPGGLPHRFQALCSGVDLDAADRQDDSLARHIWRHLLAAHDWRTLMELAGAAGATPDRARAVLESYRCFIAQDADGMAWRLDLTQPGLRARVIADEQDGGGEDAEMTAVLVGLREESLALQGTLDRLEVELGLLEQRARRVAGGHA